MSRYTSTVTKVDWMWDNYVHSSSYGAFLCFKRNFQVFNKITLPTKLELLMTNKS